MSSLLFLRTSKQVKSSLGFIIIFSLFLSLVFINFRVLAGPPPSISSVNITATTCSSTIANGVTSARVGDTLQINGSNFGSSTGSVTVNGGSFSISSWSSSVIEGSISGTGTITGNIDVVVGSRTATFSFTLNPCITSISPTSGGAGTSVTISGNEFGSSPGTGNYDTSTNNITLSGTAIPTGDVTSWSTSQIVFNVPSGSTSGNIVVTASGNVSNGMTFSLSSPPNLPNNLAQDTLAQTLTPSTYYYEVSAVTKYGESNVSSAVSVTNSSGDVNSVVWNPVVGASSYNVYRGTSATDMTQYVNTQNTYLIDDASVTWKSLGGISWSGFGDLSSATSVEYDGYVYVMGGYNGSSYLDTVYYAQLLQVGGVGTWISSPNTLPDTNGIAYATSVEYDGYVYLIGGGNSSSSVLGTVYYSKLSPSGGVGPWSSTSSLPNANGIDGATSVEYHGYVYVMGGYNGSSSLDTVYYAQLLQTGGVGTWSSSSNTLPNTNGIEGATSVEYDGYVYVIGGYDGSSYLNTVYYAQLSSTGGVGTWSTSSNTFPISGGIYSAMSVEYNGYVYVMGGLSGSSTENTIYYSQLSSTGGVGTWSSSGNSLPNANGIDASTSVEYAGYAYVIGGYSQSSDDYLNTVYYAQLSSTGGVNSWINTVNFLPSGISGASSVEYDGYVYVMGGYNGTSYLNTVYYALLLSIGGVGAWSSSTNTLPNINGIAYATSVEYDGYVYLLGGYNSTNGVLGTVYYAQLSSSGGVGTWSSSSNVLPNANGIDAASSVEYNGYIYIIGGNNATNGTLDTVYYAQLSSTGGVGTWGSSSNLLPNSYGIDHASSIVYDGYVYLLGGYNGTNGYLSTVYYASLSSTGGVNAWSTSSNNLTYGVADAVCEEYDGYVYLMGGYNSSSGYLGNVSYSQLSSTGGISSWYNLSSSLPTAAGLGDSVGAEYDGYIYTIGGYDNEYLSDVYYAHINNVPDGSFSSLAFTDTNQNTLSWSSVSGATGYKVYRGTSPGSENLYYVIYGGSITTFVDSGQPGTSGSTTTGSISSPSISSVVTSPTGGTLPYGTVYYYKVSAFDSSGEGNPSSEVSITTNGALSPPTGLTATVVTANGSTAISGSAWTNTKEVSLSADISSPNSSDTLYLLVEVEPIGLNFSGGTSNFVTSGTGVYESSAYTYTGTALLASVTVILPSSGEYHWQAAVLGNGGSSGYTVSSLDFYLDETPPSTNNVGVMAWSSAPTQIFSDGFESGTILTSDSPAGAWTADGGSSLPVVQNNIQGPVLAGTYSCNMSTSSGGTSYISKTLTTGVASLQVREYLYISSVYLATSSDYITIMQFVGSSGTIASLNLLGTSSSDSYILELDNNVTGTTLDTGLSTLTMGEWYAITFNVSISSSSGTLSVYVNGVQDESLSAENTGSSDITGVSLGAVADSTSNDSINMNIDNVRFENTSGLSLLSYDNPTPYTYTTPYFEFLGEADYQSGVNDYGVYFGTSNLGYPSSKQTTEYYQSSALSTAGVYYLNVVVYDNVGNDSAVNVNFEYNFVPPASGSVPNAPSALGQFKANGTTVIANQAWTTDGITTNIVFQFSMTSPNSTDTLTPEIELEPNGTAFTGTPNYTGTAVAYSGTAVTGVVDVSGLTNCQTYHWEAFIGNSTGLSTATVFNTTTPNFGVTNQSPTAGTVYDGSSNGSEVSANSNIASMSANWTGFSDTCSGLSSTPYTVAVGTSPGSSNVYAASSSNITLNNPSPYNTWSYANMAIHTGATYYITVTAVNNAGLTTSVTSTGQYVEPSLSFSINSSNVNLGHWNAGNSYTSTGTSSLSVLTNAYNGYTVSAYETGLLSLVLDSLVSIPNFSAGTYSSPATWASGDIGFGYTSSCTNIGGVNKFGSGTLYAPFSSSGPGDILAENLNSITGATYTGVADTYTITYKVEASSNQAAGEYQTNIVYTVIPSF